MFKKAFICIFLVITSLAFAYSDQVVVSQFSIGLRNSNNYTLTGVTPNTSMGGISLTGNSLDKAIDFEYTSRGDFNSLGAQKYSYGSNGGSAIIMPVVSSTTASSTGNFELIEEDASSGEAIKNYLIEQKFKLPKKDMVITNTINPSLAKGVKFSYSESSKVSDYKMQEFMIRISRASESTNNTFYDIVNKNNPRKLALSEDGTDLNTQYFLGNTSKYVDFLVTADQYDREQSVMTNSGLGIKFIPGSIEILGLPNGNYRMEIYSFRYTNVSLNRGSLIITQEMVTAPFIVNNNISNDSIKILGFDTSKFPNIKAEILTVSTNKILAENLSVGESAGAISNLIKESLSMSELYLEDGTLIILDADGKNGTKYYQKWEINYKSGKSVVDTSAITSTFSMPSTSTSIDYVLFINEAPIKSYPHQTIFALFNNQKNLQGNYYEILDKSMSKYTLGYRGIKEVSDTNIDSMYTGNYSVLSNMSQEDYNWKGNSNNTKGIIINKAILSSKGEFKKVSGSGSNISMPFYTLGAISGFTYNEQSESTKYDVATFKWELPEKSTYDTAITLDKMIFRIVRLGTNSATVTENYSVGAENLTEQLPRYYYNPYKGGTYGKLKNSDSDLIGFIDKTSDYVDLVFESGISETKVKNNVKFVYTANNNSLGIYGLDREKYQIQIYTLQDADSESQMYTDNVASQYTYKVLTYGDYKNFEIGNEKLESSVELRKRNNIFVLNSINFDDVPVGLTTERRVTVEFKTKTQQQLTLTNSNISFTTNGAIQVGKIEEGRYSDYSVGTGTGTIQSKSSANVSITSGGMYFYPLDIVFVIDNSGSMGNEITNVRDNIKKFSEGLRARNFDVNYNLIGFGGPQESAVKPSWINQVTKEDKRGERHYLSIYKNDGTWFNGNNTTGVTEFQGAIGSLNATGGYPAGQENGAIALDRALKYLATNGRYLAPNNTISSTQVTGGLPSKKWIIFLTDENMDTDNLPAGYTRANVLGELAQNMEDAGVVLTGIYTLNVDTASATASNNYVNNFNNVYASVTGAKPVASRPASTTQRVTITDSLGNVGLRPADRGDIYYTDFVTTNVRVKGTSETRAMEFYPYEMGADGANIAQALTAAIENIGVIQTWKLTYTSPFSESDGKWRNVNFDITNVKKKDFAGNNTVNDLPINYAGDAKDKNYLVNQDKIEARFINPNATTGYLVKKNGIIELQAIAQSLYEQNGKKVNKPIIKGTFKIKNSAGVTILTKNGSISEVVDSERNGLGLSGDLTTWYKSIVNIVETDGDIARSILKSEYSNMTVEFVAETEETNKTIVKTGVNVREADPPVIKTFKMINKTLEKFMEDLGIFNTTPTIIEEKSSSTLIPNNGVITLDSFTQDKKLNVKAGDNILIEFTLDDESIRGTSQGVYINGVRATFVPEVVDSSNPYRTKWSVTIPVTLDTGGNLVNTLNINITDDKGNRLYHVDSNGDNRPFTPETFVTPNLLENTGLTAPLTSDYKEANYYNKKEIDAKIPVLSKTADALAYLIVYDYDDSLADGNKDLSGNGKKWSSSVDGNFDFYDGKHTYNGKVYVVNSAGAILGVTHNGAAGNPSGSKIISGNITLNNVVGAISIPTVNPSIFYVDTIAPIVTSIQLEKIADKNSELNEPKLPKTNNLYHILHGIIGEVIPETSYNRPFKAGDMLKLSGNIREKNIGKITIDEENIFTDSNLGSITGTTYSKSGWAKDLGSQINEDRNVIVYDKAGNEAKEMEVGTEIKLRIAYDDRTPSALETKAYEYNEKEVKGTLSGETSATKYTREKSLPLTSEGTVPLSLVIVNGNIYGDVRKGTGELGAMGYTASNEGLYKPVITTYSYSGVGITKVDKIILDTGIGNLASGVNLKCVEARISAESLNNIVRNNYEIVGLEQYSIRPISSGINNMKSGGVTYSAGNKIALTGASYSKVPSLSTGITGGNDFTFTTVSGGKYTFGITLYDRLGHSKEINYTIEIPNNVKIIGKTSGSTKQIESKVNNASSKIKVESRKE